MVIGTDEKHAIEVAYDAATRLFRVLIDGQEAYRHGEPISGTLDQPIELRTAGIEVHTLIVEPPGLGRLPRDDTDSYRVWLDGQPVLDVPRR